MAFLLQITALENLNFDLEIPGKMRMKKCENHVTAV